MNGDGMTRDQAVAALGKPFAGIVNRGMWVTGEVVGYCATPMLAIRHADGTVGHYAIDCIESWAAGRSALSHTYLDVLVERDACVLHGHDWGGWRSAGMDTGVHRTCNRDGCDAIDTRPEG